MPSTLNFEASNPSELTENRAGASFRFVKSPDAPKTTTVTATSLVLFGNDRAYLVAFVFGLLSFYRMATELIAHCSQQFRSVTIVLTACKSLEQGERNGWGWDS